jgi:cobalt-zinc-cadmium efflux system membrane fusion protein
MWRFVAAFSALNGPDLQQRNFPMKRFTAWSVTGTLVVILAVVAFAWNRSRNAVLTSDAETESKATSDASVQPDTVALSPQKLAAAEVALTDVDLQTVRQQHFVPGRIQYDDRRHIEIRSAVAGIITRIQVKPGDRVQAGDVLLELNSPEVGNARADLLQHQADQALAQQNLDWQKSTFDGLKKLTDAIQKRVTVEQIRQEFRNVILGRSRDQLLTVYSDLLLAESLVNAAQASARSGLVPARTLEERINNRDNAEAALLGALEVEAFEATQRCRQAEASAADAQRRSQISLQTIRTLLGKGITGSAEDGADEITAIESDALSSVQLRAPFAGSIERRDFSTNERIDPGDALLILADTSTLWVAADLRERDWAALSLNPGDEISVLTSVHGTQPVNALVHFVGREVDPTTNAVPLVAVVENLDGLLRPGMSVRVVVPCSAPRESLVIPESSVLEHDRQAFVFTPDGEFNFRRVDIQPGQHLSGMVEVLSGLTQGNRVVSHGAFFLKSELLLQGEVE